jgi:hypothetical protein
MGVSCAAGVTTELSGTVVVGVGHEYGDSAEVGDAEGDSVSDGGDCGGAADPQAAVISVRTAAASPVRSLSLGRRSARDLLTLIVVVTCTTVPPFGRAVVPRLRDTTC